MPNAPENHDAPTPPQAQTPAALRNPVGTHLKTPGSRDAGDPDLPLLEKLRAG